MSFMRGLTLTAALALVVVAIAMGALCGYIVSGGLIARQKPLAAEAIVTRWMLQLSLPKAAKSQKNPLLADVGSEDVSAGQELYKQKCEICHSYDGSGKGDMGAGLYPPPLDLRDPDIKNTPDGV